MNKPSRRAVVRTGVWAVPAVATVAAAPAFATSEPPPVTISSMGDVCKLPGEGKNTKDYRFTLYLTDQTGVGATVAFGSFIFKDQTKAPTPDSVTVDPGAVNQPFEFVLYNYDDSSSNPTATIPYSVNGGDYSQSVTFTTPIHPCDTGSA